MSHHAIRYNWFLRGLLDITLIRLLTRGHRGPPLVWPRRGSGFMFMFQGVEAAVRWSGKQTVCLPSAQGSSSALLPPRPWRRLQSI